jgi:ABC-type phosphate transport system auxiliary subunit
LQKIPSISSQVEKQSLEKRKENLFEKLDDETQRTKLESIIAESAQRGSTKRGLSAGGAYGGAGGAAGR